MDETSIEYEPIGEIHTPFDAPEGMPIQPVGSGTTPGTVEVDPAYADGLADLGTFSHCILVYHFHSGNSAEAHPFRGGRKRVSYVQQSTDYDRADSPTLAQTI